MGRKSTDIMTTIARARPNGDCLEHDYKGTPKGYARVKHQGKLTMLHRMVFCHCNKVDLASIKESMVLHSCDNTRCINPEHLRLGTHADNMHDRAVRRRHASVKLTETQVLEIRASCNPGIRADSTPKPFGYRALARKYGVSIGSIRKAFLGESFKHLPLE